MESPQKNGKVKKNIVTECLINHCKNEKRMYCETLGLELYLFLSCIHFKQEMINN